MILLKKLGNVIGYSNLVRSQREKDNMLQGETEQTLKRVYIKSQ